MIIDTIHQYTPLAKSIARAFVRKLPQSVLREDVEQAAMIGLFDAARKNTDVNGHGFEWYVRQRIRGAIVDELRAQDWLPRRGRNQVNAAERAGAAVPIAVVRFEDLRSAEGCRHTWEERFATNEPSPEDSAILMQEHARALSAPLKERDRRVIHLVEHRGMMQKDAARLLGVSEPRVAQLHARAIAVMRMHLTGDVTLRPGRGGGASVEAGIPQSTIRKVIQQREQNEHQDDCGVDRTARSRQAGHPRPKPDVDRVRAGGLGSAPAELVTRAVSGTSRLARVGGAGAGCPDGRVLAMSAPVATVATSTATAAPSTLPEAGLDLVGELTRYRDWMVDQAMLRSRGNRTHAAALLKLNRTTLVEMLKRRDAPEPEPERELLAVAPLRERVDRLIAETLEETGNAAEAARQLGIGRTTLYRRLRAHCGTVEELEAQVNAEAERQAGPASAREEDPVMTQPGEHHEQPPSERSPSEPPTAVHVRSDINPYRVSRANVARLKAEGLNVRQIAHKLCVNRHLVDKMLRPIGPTKGGERRR